jgi:hypothetical protein
MIMILGMFLILTFLDGAPSTPLMADLARRGQP